MQRDLLHFSLLIFCPFFQQKICWRKRNFFQVSDLVAWVFWFWKSSWDLEVEIAHGRWNYDLVWEVCLKGTYLGYTKMFLWTAGGETSPGIPESSGCVWSSQFSSLWILTGRTPSARQRCCRKTEEPWKILH